MTYTLWRVKGSFDAGSADLNLSAGDLPGSGYEWVADFNFDKSAIGSQIPRLTVAFDDSAAQTGTTPVLVSGMQAYYKAYLPAPPGGSLRGEQYVFSFSAKLDLGGGTDYDFPADKEATAVMHSKRLDAPKQAFKFKFYPWDIGAGGAVVRYWAADPDHTLTSYGSAFMDVRQNSVSGTPAGGLADLNPVGDDSLQAASINTSDTDFATSGGRVYAGVVNGSLYRLRSPSEEAVFTRFFDALSPAAAFPSTGRFEVEAIGTENRFEIRLTGFDAARLARVAAVKVKATFLDSGNQTQEKYLPISVAGGVGVASLPYGLFGSVPNAEDKISFEVTACYDGGTGGFSRASMGDSPGSTLFALQSFLASGGGYLAFDKDGRFTVSQNAGGSLFDIRNFSEAGGTLYHKNRLSAFDGTQGTRADFSLTKDGLLLKSDNRHLNLKVLDPVTMSSIGGADAQTVIVPGASPQVRILESGVGPTGAVLSLSIENGDKLDASYRTVYVELYGPNTSSALKSEKAASAEVDDQAAAQEVQAELQSLLSNAKYWFKLWVMFDPDGDGATPLQKWYLYDPDYGEQGHLYSMQTLSDVDVGGSGVWSIVYDPRAYDNKAVKLTFSLDQTRGFKLYYSIEVLDGAYKGSYNHAALKSMNFFADSVGTAETPALTKTTRFRYKEGNDPLGRGADFWAPGTHYEITVVASTTAHSGLPDEPPGAGYLGENTFDFTMPQPGMPSFNAVATPGLYANTPDDPTDDVYRLAVATLDIDSDKVIVNSKYKVRIFNGSGVDITPENDVLNVGKSRVYTADDLPNDPMHFEDLQANSTYTLRWYAVTNVANAVNPGDVTGLNETAFAFGNKEHVIYELTAATTDHHGIYVGSVTASTDTMEQIKLTFADSVNLTGIKKIQYTVYKDASVGNNFSGKVDFTPAYVTADNVYAFTLPLSVTNPGQYSVTLRFYIVEGGSEVYIDQPVSLYHYR
jgi:hypothetical protein